MSSDDDRSEGSRASIGFEKQLLTDVDKWWEFLDPVTYQIDESQHARGIQSATEDRLDWTAVKKTKRVGPVGFGFFHRCGSCGRPVPPDITFCVHCGGQPHAINTTHPYTVIIKDFDDDRSRDACIELLLAGNDDIGVDELRHIVMRPPVVFNVLARREQVAALVARLTDLGVYARSFSTGDPSIPWISETVESFTRDLVRLGAFAVLAVLTVVGTFSYSFAILPAGLIALGFFFHAQMQWLKGRYHFAIGALLRSLTGFDGGRAAEAADLLQTLRDEDVKGSLTVAMMEYYTLHQALQSHESVYGDALGETRNILVELLDQILQSCARFQRVERFLDQARPAELRSRITRLEAELAEAPDSATRGFVTRELEAVRQHLSTHQRLERVRDDFSTRLQAMTRSMEALRSRLETVRASVSARWEDIRVEDVLAELDDELVVFEQTFEEIEMAAPKMTVGR